MPRFPRMGLMAVLVLLGQSGLLQAQTAGSSDWPYWRGPNRNGVAQPDQSPPVSWSATENVIWKTPVPGRGHSSPTVIGDFIFLATADEQHQIQSVVAFSRESGEQRWQTDISQGGFPKTHPKNTHATCTVACDGERAFVTFHHHARLTLAALNLDGEEVWKQEVGPFDPKVYEYGYAASPVLYDSLVIIAADSEKGGYLVAYDRETGRRVWKTDRPRMLSFSSPIVAQIGRRPQLLISGCEQVASYDPRTGKGIWATPGTTMATCGTMIWDGDVVFASGGYPDAQTIAVKADGSRKVVWKNNQKCYEQSMLVHDGHVYAVNDQGIAFCWRASDGREMWKQRLAGPISASPLLVGDTVYATNEAGTSWVFKASPQKYQQLAQNQLESEAFATPAICDSRIYTRVASGSGTQRRETLYCLGE